MTRLFLLAVSLLTWLVPGHSLGVDKTCCIGGCILCSMSGDDPFDALRPPADFQVDNSDPNVAAFVRQGSSWPQSQPGAPVTVTYSYNNLLDGGLQDLSGTPLTPNFLRASVEEALDLWASVAPLHFVEVEDEGGPVPVNTASPYPAGQFGQIRFHHRFINGPDIPDQTPKSKALAFFPGTRGNIAGDVFFDNGDPWEEIGTLATPDILGAAVHEIGHTLGLGHTSVSAANMYWIFQRSSGLGSAMLHEDDIAGIQSIYGAGVGSVTPLVAIPEPSSLLIASLATLTWIVRRRR